MEQDRKLLEEVARNARMGKEAVTMLLEKTEQEDMRQELGQRKAEYASFESRAEDLLARYGSQPAPLPVTEKAGLWMGLTMNTVADRSNSHIAEMMMEGSNMGIIEMTKLKKQYPQAQKDSLDLTDSFIAMEQGGIDRMKEFL